MNISDKSADSNDSTFLRVRTRGWIYDTFIFTGESPINTPWMGLKRVVRPDIKAIRSEFSSHPESSQDSQDVEKLPNANNV